jgi:DNA-binding HxlR family transcriptional regulator
LGSAEGISTNILANRLKNLEEMGLVEKQPYGNHVRRMNYQLTARGKSLRPVLTAFIRWGLEQIPETGVPNQGDEQ